MKYKIFLCLLLTVFFYQCNDIEKYYERPGWLEKPIYEVLEQEGRFSNYLQCVDSTEYALVLKGAGLYTVFAPNDSAFAAYLTKKSYASVDDIPAEERKNIAAYSIVYSKWTSEHLGDYLDQRLYVTGAFKRKTNCYALPYRDSENSNKWSFNQTTTGGISAYSTNYQLRLSDNNYKYLPVFSNAYFNSFPEPLGASDYNTFFPNSVYTGKNVQEGTILHEDIIAENGIIHEVSTVSEPLRNMDEILRDTSYSTFKSLLEFKDTKGSPIYRKYFEIPANWLDMFQKLRPGESMDKMYLKYYELLAFSPILENIFSDASNTYETEKIGNSLFVPKNEALQAYMQSKLLKYYNTIDKLPQDVVTTLINTQMVKGLVWPSQYRGSMTSTGEYVNGEGTYGKSFENAGITDKKLASNGFVFLTNDVIKSRYFETVYSEIFLNPSHAWLNQAYVNFYGTGLREDLMKSILNGYPSEKYTMLNFSDNLLKTDGYTLNSSASPPTFSNSLVSGASTDDRLKRLIRMHYFPGLKNNEVNSEITGFTTAPNTVYGGWGFLVNGFGDLVRYKNNQLQAAGNIEDNTMVTVTKVTDPYNNGQVFNVDRMLQYSPRESAIGEARWKELTLWQYLLRAKTENSGVSMFVNYVQACLKNPDTDDLDGIKTENFYTVLMVNNSAMTQAVTRGFLPTLEIINAGDLIARAKATQFLNAHFLQGTVLPDDGYTFIYPVNPMSPNRILSPTILKITSERLGLTSASTRVDISKTTTGLITFMPQNITLGTRILVTAGFGLTSTMRVQRGPVTGTTIPNNYRSNRIACKAVLHEVNNFFTFTLSSN